MGLKLVQVEIDTKGKKVVRNANQWETGCYW